MNTPPVVPPGRTARLLAELDALAAPQARLERRTVGRVGTAHGEAWPISCYIQRGPAVPGLTSLRLAVFALVHGDEPAGGAAIIRLLASTLPEPARLRGVELFCYPVCNPSGFEQGTRTNAAGRDLNREFWRGSAEPEVQALETELRQRRFDGLVSLHADCDSPGLYAFARGAVTSEELLAPALRAAEGILPRNTDRMIDGFAAEHGVIRDCYAGVLAPAPEQSPAPFEIILETPGQRTIQEQAEAAHRALLAILDELPRLSVGGPDI